MFGHRLDADSELRVLQRRHGPDLFALVDSCRPHLRKWLPWVDNTRGVADTERFITDSLAQLASNQSFQVGIWHKGELAGVCGYHPVDWRNRKTALGYWLAPQFQGMGLMTEACRALVNHAFDEMELARVEIRCATQNKKSRAIPERLGFRQEGVARRAEWLYDHFVDLVIYSMLAAEWTHANGESK